jgi:outer membrane protein assembly factor BamB
MATVATGGALAFYSGTDYIFAFRGGTTTTVWRYQVSRNRWIPVAVAPATVGAGGSMAYAGGNTMYAFRGGTTATFWRFTITPPEFNLASTAGGFTLNARIRINGSTINVLIWDVN